MKKIISVLKRQDLMNLLLLVAGFALCIVSIFMKQAQVGLIFLAIICALVISRSNNRRKRMSRMFGALYFHMPDGGNLSHDLRADEVRVCTRAAEQVRRPPSHG